MTEIPWRVRVKASLRVLCLLSKPLKEGVFRAFDENGTLSELMLHKSTEYVISVSRLSSEWNFIIIIIIIMFIDYRSDYLCS